MFILRVKSAERGLGGIPMVASWRRLFVDPSPADLRSCLGAESTYGSRAGSEHVLRYSYVRLNSRMVLQRKVLRCCYQRNMLVVCFPTDKPRARQAQAPDDNLLRDSPKEDGVLQTCPT